MKNKKRLLATLLSAVLVAGSITLPTEAANNNYKLNYIGKKERTVTVGEEFELEVKKIGTKKVKDSQLKWTIKDTSIVGFDDNDRYDDEIELRAKKAGRTTVTCNNLVTGGKLTYTVIVKKPVASNTISQVGNKTKTIRLGDDLELEVKKGTKLKNSQIQWTISDKSILRFDDGDNIGAEVEVDARKVGTTKVTAKNLATGGSIVYTVKVIK